MIGRRGTFPTHLFLIHPSVTFSQMHCSFVLYLGTLCIKWLWSFSPPKKEFSPTWDNTDHERGHAPESEGPGLWSSFKSFCNLSWLSMTITATLTTRECCGDEMMRYLWQSGQGEHSQCWHLLLPHAEHHVRWLGEYQDEMETTVSRSSPCLPQETERWQRVWCVPWESYIQGDLGIERKGAPSLLKERGEQKRSLSEERELKNENWFERWWVKSKTNALALLMMERKERMGSTIVWQRVMFTQEGRWHCVPSAFFLFIHAFIHLPVYPHTVNSSTHVSIGICI